MLLALLSMSALAAPVGDPLPDPDIGRFRLEGLADVENTRTSDADCQTDTGCTANDQTLFAGGELQLNLLEGLGVIGAVGRVQGTVDEADFSAAGIGWALGIKGALPLNPVWAIMAQGRYDHALPSNAGPGGDKGERTSITATLGLAWGAIDSGFAGYFGAQSAIWWQDSLRPLGTDGIQLQLRPSLPASGVAGFSFASTPLGAGWGNDVRIVAHVEGRVGQSTGAGAGLGLSF